MRSGEYNGWANWETWNVALWIDNDEGLRRIADTVRFTKNPYDNFIEYMKELRIKGTMDKVRWDDPKIDHSEIDEMIRGGP